MSARTGGFAPIGRISTIMRSKGTAPAPATIFVGSDDVRLFGRQQSDVDLPYELRAARRRKPAPVVAPQPVAVVAVEDDAPFLLALAGAIL